MKEGRFQSDSTVAEIITTYVAMEMVTNSQKCTYFPGWNIRRDTIRDFNPIHFFDSVSPIDVIFLFFLCGWRKVLAQRRSQKDE